MPAATESNPGPLIAQGRRREDFFHGDGVSLERLTGGLVEARTVGRRLHGVSVLVSAQHPMVAGAELRLICQAADRCVRVTHVRPWGAIQRLELTWEDELRR